MELVFDSYQASFGMIYVLMDTAGVAKVAMTMDQWNDWNTGPGEIRRDPDFCRQAITQLNEYFHGKRHSFNVPLSIQGTPFSQQVWRELLRIPFGETRSYGEIACAIGRPGSCRAVGQANRRNPLPIFIPCHRVIGKDGGLTGYMGKQGLRVKEYLLELEKSYLNSQ
jgi:methylated-DNA-[protein]-cysteine S-methyltransferase